MHYIAIFTIQCNNSIVHAIEVAYGSVSDNNEEETIEKLFYKALVGGGMAANAAFIVYIGIVFQTLFFLIAYINRMLKVGFLLVISPLITVTYSIDKMGDGKAQALESWLKEFVYTILIQPFHCIIYYSFISIAFALVSQGNSDYSYNEIAAGIMAILCIKFVNDGEKVVRKIFGFQDDNSKTAMAAGAVAAIAVAKNTTKVATGVKRGVTKVGAFGGNVKQHFLQDAPKLQGLLGGDKGIGKAIGKLASGIEKHDTKKAERKERRREKFNNSKIGAKINGAKTLGRKFKNSTPGRLANMARRQALSTAAAMATFAATYATGDTDALSAIGYGSGMAKGTDTLFDSSSQRNENEAISNQVESEKLEHEKTQTQLGHAKGALDSAEKSLNNAQPAIDKYKAAETFGNKAQKLEQEASENRKQMQGLKKGSKKYSGLEKDAHQKEVAAKKLRQREEQMRRQAEALDKDGSVTEKIESGKSAKDIEKDYKNDIDAKKKEITDLENELKNFYSKDKATVRYEARKNSVGKQDIKGKTKEIEKLIQEILAKRRLGEDSSDGELSEQDMIDSRELSNFLRDSIEKDSILHSGMSANQLMGMIGVEHVNGESAEMTDLINKLQLSVIDQQINFRCQGADKAADNDEALGRRTEKFDSNVKTAFLNEVSHLNYLDNKK